MVQDKKLKSPSPEKVQVISRAVKIVKALSNHPDGLSLTEIAKEVGLARSTVQRIVAALAQENIVEPVGPEGGVKLGPALGQIAYQAIADVMTLIHPVLEDLSTKTQETVSVTQLKGAHAFLVNQIVSSQFLQVVIPNNTPLPASLTANGKALLALKDDETIRVLLNGEIQTPNLRNGSFEGLLAELEEVRRSRFAFDFESYLEDISSIALSVQTYRGPFAIALAGPTSRINKKMHTLKQELESARTKIESLVGVKT